MTQTASPPTTSEGTPATDKAWDFLMTTLDNLGDIIDQDAIDARERLEGRRVLTRILALCSELCVDVDPDFPRFFSMTTALRQVGGPNPDGEYDLCTVRPGTAYRLTGQVGTVTYLGFQVMAGTGLNPRRQAVYVSDRDLVVDDGGRFELVLAPQDPGLPDVKWVPIPEDTSALVARQYVVDHATAQLATYRVESLAERGPTPVLDDETMAAQLTALTWTAVKLMTLHRTVAPELLTRHNELLTAEPEALGSENTTPDNLYMLGLFDLDDDQALTIEFTPPETRYWGAALESIWHECLEPHRGKSSLTLANATPRPDGSVQLVIAHHDPGVPNWLDTAGRRRGFITLRWLDHHAALEVNTQLVKLPEVTA